MTKVLAFEHISQQLQEIEARDEVSSFAFVSVLAYARDSEITENELIDLASLKIPKSVGNFNASMKKLKKEFGLKDEKEGK